MGAKAGFVHVRGELVRFRRLLLGNEAAGDGLVEQVNDCFDATAGCGVQVLGARVSRFQTLQTMVRVLLRRIMDQNNAWNHERAVGQAERRVPVWNLFHEPHHVVP